MKTPDMKLETLLAEKRSAILETWFDHILDTYPQDAAKFFREQKNRFANPVGTTIAKEINGLLDAVIQGIDPEGVSRFLDNVVRIRAVQDFTPSRAIGFVFALKNVIREALREDLSNPQIWEELLVVESRIDEMAQLAFDIYVKCRLQIYEIRATEFEKRTYRLLKQANVLYDLEGKETDSKDKRLGVLKKAR